MLDLTFANDTTPLNYSEYSYNWGSSALLANTDELLIATMDTGDVYIFDITDPTNPIWMR